MGEWLGVSVRAIWPWRGYGRGGLWRGPWYVLDTIYMCPAAGLRLRGLRRIWDRWTRGASPNARFGTGLAHRLSQWCSQIGAIGRQACGEWFRRSRLQHAAYHHSRGFLPLYPLRGTWLG